MTYNLPYLWKGGLLQINEDLVWDIKEWGKWGVKRW